MASTAPNALKQAARQACYRAGQLQLQQRYLQSRRGQASTRLQGIQPRRVVTQGLQQWRVGHV